jgi:tetratricopeptide (TPR) repeat protein
MPTLEQLLPLLQADPGDAFLRYAVAMEYSKQAQHDQALAEFAELAKRHPDYVAGYFMAGRAAEQKEDLEQAKALYRQGIAAAKRTGDRHAESEISSALMMIE